MYNNNYILGIDIGISSIGWALLELDETKKPCRIIDVGSRIFPPGETEKAGESRAKERREKRGTRRLIRRKAFRMDRIRNFLYEYNFLEGNVNSKLVSEKNEELTKIFKQMLERYYQNKKTNPYELKVKALDKKLEKEELCIILVHYAKKRGYKSNRESSANNNEDGKVLGAISENKKLMESKNYRIVSEMYILDEKFKDRIRNSPNDYKISVSREMLEEEINKVLDSQIKFGLIDENFKKDYLEIWNGQRHYSKGPGGNSPYGGDLIAKMVGKCLFDKEPRAPKKSPSSEIFVALTKLLNLRYKSLNNKDYTGLNSDELNKVINEIKEKSTYTYKDLAKILNKTELKFKELQLTKKEYVKFIEEFKTKIKYSKDKKIELNNLTTEEKKLYDNLYEKKLFSKKLVELDGYHKLKKVIKDCFGKEEWELQKDNLELLDELAVYCTNYKLDEDISEHIKESNIINTKYNDPNFIKALPNFKDHLMLSTKIIYELIPLMLKGLRYDEAMKELGYNFSDTYQGKEKKDLLVPINNIQTINNQRVIRSLTQARKIINAIIKKYGSPKIINIETARELAKTRQERNEIKKLQDKKMEDNIRDKNILVELGLFSDHNKITGNDLLKYRLWKEQKECCAYSMEKITLDDLFINNKVQIDHILPYSRTFNDNYLNKTLVFTKYNQEKGNKTPYEWFGNTEKWQKFETFINDLNIPTNKKDNYLLRKLDNEIERQMREQNLNDTKYISKELAALIKAYLNVEKVNVYQGAITAKLRARWGFNRLTHSFISENYYMPDNIQKDINKDRDNHLHHAMDALVIASLTPSLQQNITQYEKFSRYIDGIAKSKLEEMSTREIKSFDGVFYNDETGDVDEKSFKEYLKNEMINNGITFKNQNLAKLKFPLPYEGFDEEAKIRVYEQNEELLKWKLQSLPNYSKQNVKEARVLTPSIAKAKISGKMHEDTYYGLKEKDNIIYKTSRKPLEKIKKEDLDKIITKDGGSKDIYNAILSWLGDYDNGADALKAHKSYPINPNDKEKKQIKKIKLYEEYKNTGHIINNCNVDKGSVYRIDVMKSNNLEDDKLYFIAYDIFDIKKLEAIKKGKENAKNFMVKLEYGQSSNNIITNYKNVLENYTLINTLYKNDLVKITTKNGRRSVAYIVGFSSGKLEVKSVLGDGYDLVQTNSIFENVVSRFTITASTIEKIEKLSISILGDISGL